MDFESKIISREVSEILWETEKTVGTAESCTGGRIAEAIISVPGASKYFKGGIISYVNEIKAYRGKNVFNCVAAQSDEEFEQLRDQMIKELQETYHVDEVFQYFYDQAASQADSVAELAALQAEINAQIAADKWDFEGIA